MLSLNIFVSEMVTYIKNSETRFAKVGKNVRYLELASPSCGLRFAVCNSLPFDRGEPGR